MVLLVKKAKKIHSASLLIVAYSDYQLFNICHIPQRICNNEVRLIICIFLS